MSGYISQAPLTIVCCVRVVARNGCWWTSLGQQKVLIIDDDAQIAALIAAAFRQADYAVQVANGGIAGARMAAANPPDAVVTDIIMADGEGVETIMAMRKLVPGVKILAISGAGRIGSQDLLDLARAVGADATLSKPFRPTTLVDQVRGLLALPALTCPSELA